MATLETRDPRLLDLVAPDAPVDRIAGGLTFTEGPVWGGSALLFSDIPNKRIARWRKLPEGPELTTYATGMSNGLTLDRQGHVLAAEHDGRRVTRGAEDRPATGRAGTVQRQRAKYPERNGVQVRGLHLLPRPALCRAPRPAGHGAACGMVDQADLGEGAAL